MHSICQWIVLTTACAVYEVSLQRSARQIITDLGWITVAIIMADVIWAVWNLVVSRGEGSTRRRKPLLKMSAQ